MRSGVSMLVTDESVRPDELGRTVEARGFERVLPPAAPGDLDRAADGAAALVQRFRGSA